MKVDMELVMELVENDDNEGICTECGEIAYGVEPDARNYECESCGANQVFGAEELLIMYA